jgi:stage V sporulation protein SpoVS
VPRTEGSWTAACGGVGRDPQPGCRAVTQALGASALGAAVRQVARTGLIAQGIDVQYTNAPTLFEFPHLKDSS